MADEFAVAPATLFDTTKLSTESLTMLYIFVPQYTGELEFDLIAVTRKELVSRGVLQIVNDRQEMWDLPEGVREELREVFVVNNMAELFNDVTAPDSDDDDEESEAL